MQTTVSKRGQTIIPAAIRNRYSIHEGDALLWMDDGETIRIVPMVRDIIQTLRGRGRGEQLADRLLRARQQDRDHGQ